ncbi:MAG: LPP20 family lipoprotein [Methylacidiphilales bacterium]|nr:LPP20 family lipoprotein [Candidatus Methylacidiphilales bacterium]
MKLMPLIFSFVVLSPITYAEQDWLTNPPNDPTNTIIYGVGQAKITSDIAKARDNATKNAIASLVSQLKQKITCKQQIKDKVEEQNNVATAESKYTQQCLFTSDIPSIPNIKTLETSKDTYNYYVLVSLDIPELQEQLLNQITQTLSPYQPLLSIIQAEQVQQLARLPLARLVAINKTLSHESITNALALLQLLPNSTYPPIAQYLQIINQAIMKQRANISFTIQQTDGLLTKADIIQAIAQAGFSTNQSPTAIPITSSSQFNCTSQALQQKTIYKCQLQYHLTIGQTSEQKTYANTITLPLSFTKQTTLLFSKQLISIYQENFNDYIDNY